MADRPPSDRSPGDRPAGGRTSGGDPSERARQVLYVSVGAGLLAYQRAQIARRQVGERLGADALGDRARAVGQAVESRAQAVDRTVDQLAAPLEGQLPAEVRATLRRSRTGLRRLRGRALGGDVDAGTDTPG